MSTQTIALEKAGKESVIDASENSMARTQHTWSSINRFFLRPGLRLAGLVGTALIALTYLIQQQDKVPHSSLSYSLLNVIISLLVNFSSALISRTRSS